VPECERVASIMRRPWPTRGCCNIEKNDNITVTIIMTRSDRNRRYIRTSAEGGLILKVEQHLRLALGLCQCNG
jgi:hypothetical protein